MSKNISRPLIIAMRHGATKFNSSKHGDGVQRIRGWLDLPLTEEGRKESQETAQKVAKFPLEEIYSSDLQRAEATADFVSELVNIPVQPTRALRPWDLGYLTAQPVEQVMPVMKKFVENPAQKVPGGESFDQFRERCLSFVKAVCEKATADKRTICIVCHTRNLQLIKAWAAAGAPDDLSIDYKTMEDYSKEVAPSGFLEIEPGEKLGPEYKETDLSKDADKDEQ